VKDLSDTPDGLVDRRGRPLRDLRISVTDRCNFRCRYCMPRDVFGESFRFLPHAQILTYEEVTRLAAIFLQLGVRKLRLTGGEPLLRRDLPRLVEMLAALPQEDLALTTNASLLARDAAALAAAGLRRVTVSLDSLDEEVFRRMNDVDFAVGDVLAGIAAAEAAGLPVKINTVVQRGVNDHTVVELVKHFRGRDVVVRFIEYMDVGTTNGWRLTEVVPGEEILRRIGAEVELTPLPANYPGEVASRWALPGGGEIGVITSVTRPFCGGCTRARLSAEGRLFTCLFAAAGSDLKEPLRRGDDDGALRERIAGVWRRRADRYSEERSAHTRAERVEMSYIGG